MKSRLRCLYPSVHRSQELELSCFGCDLFSRGAVAGGRGPGETGGKYWNIYSVQEFQEWVVVKITHLWEHYCHD